MYAAPRYGPLRAKRFLEVAVAVLTILGEPFPSNFPRPSTPSHRLPPHLTRPSAAAGILSGVVQEVLCLLLSRPEQQPARVTA
eukprot:2794122-Rhodomonas_salina.1